MFNHPECDGPAQPDAFTPCALGAVPHDATVPRLACRLVCVRANGQLAETCGDSSPTARGIGLMQDCPAHTARVIDFRQGWIDDRPGRCCAVEQVRGATSEPLARAVSTGETPPAVADRMMRERLAVASCGTA